MTNVFVSYRSTNAGYVKRLAKELERNNITVWFDKSELHQFTGEEYAKHIHDGIDSAELFLLMYTKDVETSDFIIEQEVGYAISQNKKILFFPQENIDLSTSRLKDQVKSLQWIDTKETATHQTDTQESIHDEKKLNTTIALTKIDKGFSLYEDENLFLIRLTLQRILGKVTQYGNYVKLAGCGAKDFYSREHVDIRILNKTFFLEVPQKYFSKLNEKRFFRKDKTEMVDNLIKSIAPDDNTIKQMLQDFMEKNKDYYTPERVHEWLVNHLQDSIYSNVEVPSVDKLTVDAILQIVSEMSACDFLQALNEGKTMFNGAELGVYNIFDNRTANSEFHTLDIELYYSDYFTFKCMTKMFHILYSIMEGPLTISTVRDIHEVAPFLCSIGMGGFVGAKINGVEQLLWTKRSDVISSGDMWHFSFDETVSVQKDAIQDKDGNFMVEDNILRIDYVKSLRRALSEELGIHHIEGINGRDYGLVEVGIIQSERLEIELIGSATIDITSDKIDDGHLEELRKLADDGYLEISKLHFFPLFGTSHLVGKFLTPESLELCKRIQLRYQEQGRNIGEETLVEAYCQIDPTASVGHHCRIHRNVFIDQHVKIGNYVKIQNNNSIYEGVTLEDGVFVGTNVCFTNDRYPRSIKENGSAVKKGDWILEETLVKHGASIGAGAVILSGITIGEWAMVGAGSVVVEDVPARAIVAGNPAKVIRYL